MKQVTNMQNAAKIKRHLNTITDNWDAGWGEQGGYAAFKLGSALKILATLN